uniref:Uncharacterized protein n=1 Tax=Chenopodium quinoa TaxID=63459 RepID=A0A803LLZ9_CHEQI
MVQMLYVSAQCLGDQCSPTTACCEEFACVNNVCTDCEDHAGHSCDDRECCPELSCLPNPNSPPTNICVNCEEHPGHPCTPDVQLHIDHASSGFSMHYDDIYTYRCDIKASLSDYGGDGVDYSPQFQTREVFPTYQAAVDWAREIATPLGFFLTNSSYKKQRNGLPINYMKCDRGERNRGEN